MMSQSSICREKPYNYTELTVTLTWINEASRDYLQDTVAELGKAQSFQNVED